MFLYNRFGTIASSIFDTTIEQRYNIVAAMFGISIWILKSLYIRHKKGSILGVWLPALLGYYVLRAITTIVVTFEIIKVGISGEAAYFGFLIVLKLIFAAWFAISILIDRPLALWLVKRVVEFPEVLLQNPRFKRVFNTATWVFLAYVVTITFFDIFRYNQFSVNWYVLSHGGINWVGNMIILSWIFFYLEKNLKALEGWPGIVTLMESFPISAKSSKAHNQT